MTKARTLADMISDGVIGTTELADDVITPVKLDETGNYQMAQLGIGTGTPQAELHLSTASTPEIRLTDTTNTVEANFFANDTLGTIGSKSNHAFAFNTNNTQRMSISSTGDVAINGDLTGLRYFDVYNTASGSTDGAVIRLITEQVGSTATTSADIVKRKNGELRVSNFDQDPAAYIAFSIGTAERMKITSGGNVGIGVSPSYKLDVDVGAPSSSDQVLGRFSSQAGTRSIGYVWDDSASTLGISTLTNHAMTFHINGNSNEKMRLDTSGNLLVGKTSTGSSVRGSELRDGTSGFVATFKSDGDGINIDRSTDGGLINLRVGGNPRGAIGTSGNNLAIHGAGSGSDATGVMFVNSGSTQRIVPCQENFTLNDGVIDLGHSSNRFKHLYLSGPVNAGGYTMNAGDFTLNRTDGFDNSIVLSTAANNANRNVIFQKAGGGPINGMFQFRGKVTKPDQPTFKAGRTGNYIPGAGNAILFNDTGGNYTNHHWNVGNHYSTSTGRFTAPVTGTYLVQSLIIFGPSLANGQKFDDIYDIMLNNNRVTYSFKRAEYVDGTTGNGGYYTDHANALVKMSANEYVWCEMNYSNISVHGNTAYSWFSAYLLG